MEFYFDFILKSLETLYKSITNRNLLFTTSKYCEESLEYMKLDCLYSGF